MMLVDVCWWCQYCGCGIGQWCFVRLFLVGFILWQIDNKQFRYFIVIFCQCIVNKCQSMVFDLVFFIGVINFIVVWCGCWCCVVYQYVLVVVVIFVWMLFLWCYWFIGCCYVDVVQIQCWIVFVQYVIVVGKIDKLIVGVIDMDVVVVVQCVGCVGGGNVYGVQIFDSFLKGYYFVVMMKIILLLCIWLFGVMNKYIVFLGWMYGYYVYVCVLCGMINGFYSIVVYVYLFNGFVGK